VSPKILVVDDDRTLLRFVGEYLEREGFQVVLAERGPDALRAVYVERPDLVALDVMMPGMDGWEVCARLRELSDTPVVLLTAKTSEADKLRGFRLGVDDYITKPFSLAELGARVRAILARSVPRREGEPATATFGDLVMDFTKRKATRSGDELTLTPTEYRLLATLARRAGQAVSQEDLIREVWGEYREQGWSALRRYIWFLRQKIEPDPENPKHLITVRGFGYRLEG
jgi:two-component system KDP operon response regulator KdpE